MAAFVITPARPEDAGDLARIYLEGRRAILPEAATAALALGDFARDSEGERVFVARGADRADPLGFLSLWAADHFIHMLYLRPDAQGSGIGTALLRALPDWPEPPYRLKCLTANARARGFYLAQGFRVLAQGQSEDGPYEEMGIGPAA